MAQNFKNHGRVDPAFHFFVSPVMFLAWVTAATQVVRHFSWVTLWMLVLMTAALLATFKIRLYALKVQDRVIRLEERLRLQALLPVEMQPRIGEFTIKQLVALRFASDEELPALAIRALNDRMEPKAIKQAIQNWRADEWRV